MTREFPDELLSAHLDGELTDAERAKVERLLAASPPDRQLFEDLKSLRGELASLPRAEVSPDFADRVVQAAVAEAEKYNEARGVVSRAPPVPRHFWRRWKYGAAAASAVALAACGLLVVLLRRHSAEPQPGQAVGPIAMTPDGAKEAVIAVASLPEQLLSALTNAAPKNRDAVVLRLKVAKGVSVTEALDKALGKAGIGELAGNVPGAATLIQEAYLQSLAGNNGNGATSAAEAIFIEAPFGSLQGALTELASSVQDPLELEMYGKFALHRGEERAEGEGPTAPARPFAQRLDASHFHFAAKAPPSAKAPLLGNLPANQAVRVLLLIDAQ
jgi:anti-sigma factor RsiW